MSKRSYLIGKAGEDLAKKYLIKKGYIIIEKNFRSRRGEIDLIAQENGILIFIEVKTYSFQNYLSPLAAVSKYKKTCIIHAAKSFLIKKNLRDIICRFDVLIIFSNEHGGRRFLLIKNAFEMC